MKTLSVQLAKTVFASLLKRSAYFKKKKKNLLQLWAQSFILELTLFQNGLGEQKGKWE